MIETNKNLREKAGNKYADLFKKHFMLPQLSNRSAKQVLQEYSKQRGLEPHHIRKLNEFDRSNKILNMIKAVVQIYKVKP